MLTLRQRAHVTTADLHYRSHYLEIEDDARGKVVTIRNSDDDVLRQIVGAAVESKHGDDWRITGTVDGVPVVWRAVKGCACTSPGVFPTDSWDVPT